ncbi:hypothetical protein I4U23_004605 [Adineta vaga]|nr:hypothetical protein I4U23_004605 [Adineta vaga]
MTNQTTMIIITSDDNLIQQFASNKNENTYMINLNDQQNTPIELTRNDQVYKRTIDTSDYHQTKSVKIRKKSLDSTCMICGDCAIGYNYAVLSCASCKAFFHRNGQCNPKEFKCLTNHGQCVIDCKISRKCFHCRLERCLTMGMRKDFLLKQDEIQRRKNSSRSRNNSLTYDEIDRLFMNSDELDYSLTIQDWESINKIYTAFLSIINGCEDMTDFDDVSNQTSEIICCLQSNNEIALQMIKFCRLIDDFEKLNGDDRFLLIKYNLMILFCISTCTIMKPTDDGSLDEEDKRYMYIICNQSDHIYEMVINVGITIRNLIQDDNITLSLLLVICLFSKGLSMNENEPSLNDSLAVYRLQSYYTKLLWNYLIKKQGETKTCQNFTQLLTAIFRAQSAAKKFREFLSGQATTLDTVDDIAPLMQTLLHIS